LVLKDLFRKQKYVTVKLDQSSKSQVPVEKDFIIDKVVPDELWVKCPKCNEIMYQKELRDNYKVCGKCGYHFRLKWQERLILTLDENSFIEYDSEIESTNPLNFIDYEQKIATAKMKTELNEAVITGEGTISNIPVVIAVFDFSFMGGSMGSVVGEKVTRAVETAVSKKLPFIAFTASGGARMQEGILSLMQMAKTSAAIAKLNQAGLLYIAVLTDPTTGGVTASFASLGDIIIAEPGALIGFAGPRVIEQTIRQKLPDGFQTAEFMEKHGMVDLVVDRREMRSMLTKILEIHQIRS